MLFDTNVLISYLLVPLPGRNPTTIVEAVFADAFSLVLPKGIVAELTRRVGTKPHLTRRIPVEAVTRLVARLAAVAEIVPNIGKIPAIGRDRKDHFVLAHAIRARANYLVTGDDDLLVLVEVEGVKIVSPAEFVGLLEEQGLI